MVLGSFQAMADIDWKNPPVMCPEDVFPKGLKCLDFSKVTNVLTDFPDSTTADEIKDWKANKAADLRLCRHQEILKREASKPGTYGPAQIENSWMIVNGSLNVKEKLEAVNEASSKYEIPPHVLLGAMRQESLLSSLGVSPDGGNYSCGISQLNIREWCGSINKLSDAEKAQYGWPESIECEDETLPTDIVKPFYDIAVSRLGNRPSYQMTSADFAGITKDQVVKGFPKASRSIQAKRFQAVASFVNNCQNIRLATLFKARTLRGLFLNFVPKEIRQQNLYSEGETFAKTCASAYTNKAYPLHTGWILAVAMYNAGPVQSKLLDHYFQIKDNQYPTLSPLDLIEALHWGGKYSSSTNSLEFQDQSGKAFTQKWFKSCIVQRHVARVIQHVTLPVESIAKSLEREGCKQDTVPEYRKASSGIK